MEALALLADNLARRVQAGGDGVVAQPLAGHEHDLGPDHIAIW